MAWISPPFCIALAHEKHTGQRLQMRNSPLSARPTQAGSDCATKTLLALNTPELFDCSFLAGVFGQPGWETGSPEATLFTEPPFGSAGGGGMNYERDSRGNV